MSMFSELDIQIREDIDSGMSFDTLLERYAHLVGEDGIKEIWEDVYGIVDDDPELEEWLESLEDLYSDPYDDYL